MLCSKLHCQKGFNLIPFSYKIWGHVMFVNATPLFPTRGWTCNASKEKEYTRCEKVLARWSTTLLSKVNFPHAIKFRA